MKLLVWCSTEHENFDVLELEVKNRGEAIECIHSIVKLGFMVTPDLLGFIPIHRISYFRIEP